MENISGINSIEIIQQPSDTMVGLKWKEGRTMFGKEAFETMWVTDAKDNEFYQTRAESHGAVYISRFDLSEENGQCTLTMSFEGQPQSAGGRRQLARSRSLLPLALRTDGPCVPAADGG